jgi:hypothetical protein
MEISERRVPHFSRPLREVRFLTYAGEPGTDGIFFIFRQWKLVSVPSVPSFCLAQVLDPYRKLPLDTACAIHVSLLSNHD